MSVNNHALEIASGNRFEFGKNWESFLERLNEERINIAIEALRKNLAVDGLCGKTFLDIGSGSGLSSLAAFRLGARVISFDYDPASVSCTAELRKTYAAGEESRWSVFRGSLLDDEFMSTLKQSDVVYSWGVIHHTGDMWSGLRNVVPLVKKNGQLFIAIYNDQGGQSRRWLVFKKIYNTLPSVLKLPYAIVIMGVRELRSLAIKTIRLSPASYFKNIRNYASTSDRGMSYWHDLIDWIGGYPFEVAKPEEIFSFYRAKGFVLDRLHTAGGELGCNEYVFTRAE